MPRPLRQTYGPNHRDGRTSRRFPIKFTCECGVVTAIGRDGQVRAHRRKTRRLDRRAPSFDTLACMNDQR